MGVWNHRPAVDMQAPIVSTSETEPAQIVATLRRALAAVDQLSSERAALEEALKARNNIANMWPLGPCPSCCLLYAKHPVMYRLLLRDATLLDPECLKAALLAHLCWHTTCQFPEQTVPIWNSSSPLQDHLDPA